MIDRRELLHRAAMVMGGALSAGGVSGVLAGCVAAPEAGPAPNPLQFFNAQEMNTVAAMAEQILPRTDTPGAVDVGVPAFIDRMLAGYYAVSHQDAVRKGLVRASEEARARKGVDFGDLAAADQVALMQVWDREAFEQGRRAAAAPDAPPHFFRIMKELTTLGYFTSEAGATQFLRYALTPGEWRADVPYSEIGRAWAT